MKGEKNIIKKKRLFLGLGISGPTKEEIEELVGQMVEAKSGVRWEYTDNLHLNLIYLGDVSDPKQEMIEDAIYWKLKELKPFEFRLGELDCFPRISRASVVFLGIKEGHKKIVYLTEQLRKSLEGTCGYRFDATKIVPHVTIGRARRKIKGYEREVLADLLRETKADMRAINKVISVVLFESKLTTKAGKYRVVKSFRIGEKEE